MNLFTSSAIELTSFGGEKVKKNQQRHTPTLSGFVVKFASFSFKTDHRVVVFSAIQQHLIASNY